MKARAVFLDRDGVLCDNRRSYVKEWQEFHWIDGALEALRLLASLDLRVIVVSNQSAINRGLTTLEAVHDLHQQMQRDVQQAGGRLDAIYFCPHGPDEGCSCRKPGLLLFQTACSELDLDLSQSYLVGDSLSDLRAGWALNLRVLLVRSGLGKETAKRLDGVRPVDIVDSVLTAARWIQSDAHSPMQQLSRIQVGESR